MPLCSECGEALTFAASGPGQARRKSGYIDIYEMALSDPLRGECADGCGVDLELSGDLARILYLCGAQEGAAQQQHAQAVGTGRVGDLPCVLSVVAGRRNQRYLHLDWATI